MRYPDIAPTNILGHGDIAVGRKKDPGPLFPWYTLHQAGIGAWPDKDTVGKYLAIFSEQMPPVEDVIEKLAEYGYATNVEIEVPFIAFQMHFRPKDYQGKLDVETAAIAYALYDKYILGLYAT